MAIKTSGRGRIPSFFRNSWPVAAYHPVSFFDHYFLVGSLSAYAVDSA